MELCGAPSPLWFMHTHINMFIISLTSEEAKNPKRMRMNVISKQREMPHRTHKYDYNFRFFFTFLLMAEAARSDEKNV